MGLFSILTSPAPPAGEHVSPKAALIEAVFQASGSDFNIYKGA